MRRAAPFLFFLLLLLSSRLALAAPRSDPAFEQKIRDELRQIDPAAVPALDAADSARDKNDFDRAVKGYEEVLRFAPKFHHAERRLCGIYVVTRRRDEGIALCRSALATSPTWENHSALAMALTLGESPSQADLSQADFHVARAEALAPNEVSVFQTMCILSMRREDLGKLHACSTRLLSLAPSDADTHFFASLDSAAHGDLDTANAEIEKARTLGLPDERYRVVKERLASARPLLPRMLVWLATAVGIWFAAFGLLFAVGSVLSKSTLRAASTLPAQHERDGHARGSSAFLRRIYRSVLWISSAFYYVSLPLLAVVLVALGIGLVLGSFAIGYIPIKLLIIAGIAIVTTLWAIVRSLFVRVKDEDPGERVDLRKEPKLRAALDEVAERIGTRPVDAVYLTPFTDVAVLERGGFAKQLTGGTERALVLGAGVLDGMSVRMLKGILAHEYGHFHNEDTAGGGFALMVRRSIVAMANALAESGASGLNPAVWFLRGFYAVFLRISQGASRLQEVLADRWAAFAYGSHTFEEGLRHVIRRDLAFEAHANTSLAEVLDQRRALVNLYSHRPGKAPTEEEVAKAFDEVWNAAPSPYESHPRPADRIAWVLALEAEGAARGPDDDAEAWSLFEDRGEVEEQMTSLVCARVGTMAGIALAAPEAADETAA